MKCLDHSYENNCVLGSKRGQSRSFRWYGSRIAGTMCKDDNCKSDSSRTRRLINFCLGRVAERVRGVPRSGNRYSVWFGGIWLLLLSAVSSPTSSIWVTADEGSPRPEWIRLDRTVTQLFRSSEVLQMYHIEATATLYEQGGLNHDLSYTLTAVAFYSLDNEDAKVSIAYHPTNMTISLLPVISEDGQELHWENQEASVSYVKDLDQSYWTGTSYMGETTGAFFSYAVDISMDYQSNNPRYQPFSVYNQYPGEALVTASSCDEFVWMLLSEAQMRGVRLAPAVMPQKYKIVIYSQTDPDIITLEDPDSYSTATSSSSDDQVHAGVRHGSRRLLRRRELISSLGSDLVATTASHLTDGKNHWRESPVSIKEARGLPAASTLKMRARPSRRVEEEGEDENGDSGAEQGGLVQEGLEIGAGASSNTSIPTENDDEVNEGGETEAVDLETSDTVLGTDYSATTPVEESVTAPLTAAAPGEMSDWEQVVTYYQSLQLCLQERKFNFVASLKDFAQYFDCLDDVAFICKDPHHYYKVNLTSTRLDSITPRENLPKVDEEEERFTWVDISLVVWMVMILACGVHLMLWQAGVMQHWMKTEGYTQANQVLAEDSASTEQPSLRRKITTEYLRVGSAFLGKSSTIGSPTGSNSVPSSEQAGFTHSDKTRPRDARPMHSLNGVDEGFCPGSRVETRGRRLHNSGALSDGASGQMEAGREWSCSEGQRDVDSSVVGAHAPWLSEAVGNGLTRGSARVSGAESLSASTSASVPKRPSSDPHRDMSSRRVRDLGDARNHPEDGWIGFAGSPRRHQRFFPTPEDDEELNGTQSCILFPRNWVESNEGINGAMDEGSLCEEVPLREESKSRDCRAPSPLMREEASNLSAPNDDHGNSGEER